MKIGIAAATLPEAEPVSRFIQQQQDAGDGTLYQLLITGIGSVAATYRLTRYIMEQQPDYILQAGIGGTFTEKFPPGAVVLISDETMGDLGAGEHGGFKDLFDLGLLEAGTPPFTGRRLVNPHLPSWEKFGLPAARGITVNEITTLPERIGLLREKYQCDIESMEGAALHYVCLREQVAFMQMRAVSNYIGERDKSKWALKASIQNLNDTLIQVIQKITKL